MSLLSSPPVQFILMTHEDTSLISSEWSTSVLVSFTHLFQSYQEMNDVLLEIEHPTCLESDVPQIDLMFAGWLQPVVVHL